MSSMILFISGIAMMASGIVLMINGNVRIIANINLVVGASMVAIAKILELMM